jgi:mono/diheme cytochrome c family protein
LHLRPNYTRILPTTPIPATTHALHRTGVEPRHIDFVAINDLLAPAARAWQKESGGDFRRVTVNGSAIAPRPPGRDDEYPPHDPAAPRGFDRARVRYGHQNKRDGGGQGNATIGEQPTWGRRPRWSRSDGMSIKTAFLKLMYPAALGLTLVPIVAWAGAEEGKTLYAQKCQACHSLEGVAGKMAKLGGPLDGVGAKRSADWLRAYLKDPKSQIPEAKMPKLALTDQQFDDAVAYILTLTKPAPSAQ